MHGVMGGKPVDVSTGVVVGGEPCRHDGRFQTPLVEDPRGSTMALDLILVDEHDFIHTEEEKGYPSSSAPGALASLRSKVTSLRAPRVLA